MQVKAQLMDQKAIDRALTRIAHEIIEKNHQAKELTLVGIKRRGIPLAGRLIKKIEQYSDIECFKGELDISFYRDDLSHKSKQPEIHSVQIEGGVQDKTIIIVDDVLFTGRTARCAIEAIFDQGRPQKIQLAILIDRGHRELPIRPDFIGKNVPSSKSETILVKLSEYDESEEVLIADLLD